MLMEEMAAIEQRFDEGIKDLKPERSRWKCKMRRTTLSAGFHPIFCQNRVNPVPRG
jgi:hypothetical protein